MELIIVKENYAATIVWNTDTSFSEIYFLQSKKPNLYREVGTVLTYFHKGDGELMLPHWKGECYLEESHFDDGLIDSILDFLLKNTKCESPLWLDINKGERHNGKYRQVGNIAQPGE